MREIEKVINILIERREQGGTDLGTDRMIERERDIFVLNLSLLAI